MTYSDGFSMNADLNRLVASFRSEAAEQFTVSGWEDHLVRKLLELGEPIFIEAILDLDIDRALALQKAMLHGRHLLMTALMEQGLTRGDELGTAFKSLLVITRQNAIRAGTVNPLYPRAWVNAAVEAVESASHLQAPLSDLVLIGFNVFAAAAAGALEDEAAVARETDVARPNEAGQNASSVSGPVRPVARAGRGGLTS